MTASAWDRLNARQQTFLQLIYVEDQAQERAERRRAAFDQRSQPAEQWRWITHANTISGRTPLKQAIKDAGLLDSGTGSTYKALATRGYILVRSEGATSHPHSDLIVHVRLTTQGRKLVRDAQGVAAPKKMVVGTLQEWHWRALSKAYAAGNQGVPSDGIGYGRMRWNTWLRLRDYAIKGMHYPLIEERNGVSITNWGTGYYERSYQRYRDRYPDIEAPTPASLCDPSEPFVEVVQGHRPCRACRGEQLIAVTRTYQQNAKGVWSIEQHQQRIPGIVTLKYQDVEQCLCQEEEIQQHEMPWFALLDWLATQDWQIGFVSHPWTYDLHAMIGGVVSRRGLRWYDPTFVKQKLLPLLSDADLSNDLHEVKGEVHYVVNEHQGCGSIYPSGLKSGWSLGPIVRTRAPGGEGNG